MRRFLQIVPLFLILCFTIAAPAASAGVPLPTDNGIAVNPGDPGEQVVCGKDNDCDDSAPPMQAACIRVDGPAMEAWGPAWTDHHFMWNQMTMRYENTTGASVEFLLPDEFHPGWRARFCDFGSYWDWDYYLMG
ncbi:MAG: hypothetical protein Q7R62_02490 [bacterium]|nr:hypothetical protein [bacterium]